MKAVGIFYVGPKIRVQQNTTKNAPNYGVIKDARTGRVLHRGQVGYIRKLAKTKYNVYALI